jgi:hypothetical protein
MLQVLKNILKCGIIKKSFLNFLFFLLNKFISIQKIKYKISPDFLRKMLRLPRKKLQFRKTYLR